MTRQEIANLLFSSEGAHSESELLDRIELVARAAAEVEREACAKLCEETTSSWTEYVYNQGCLDCAFGIRLRGKP